MGSGNLADLPGQGDKGVSFHTAARSLTMVQTVRDVTNHDHLATRPQPCVVSALLMWETRDFLAIAKGGTR